MGFKKMSLLVGACVGILSACQVAPVIGTKPSDTPPQVVNNPSNPDERHWDNTAAFGPVPLALTSNGQATCATLNTKDVQYQAIGYHPKAKNFEGQTMAGGGYLCYPK